MVTERGETATHTFIAANASHEVPNGVPSMYVGNVKNLFGISVAGNITRAVYALKDMARNTIGG
jgi:hypothetical protein